MMTMPALYHLFRDTMENGHRTSPRGMAIRELIDAQIRVDPNEPFQLWPERKYNLEYFKTEMRWKLGASKYDESIKDHAKMWESVQNPDGTFNSNYGQFWFGQQQGVNKVVMELIRDLHSRRATIPMLSDAHLSPETKDTVCTEAVTFHVRNNRLMATVHMRSSDQIFGLGTDIPTFSVLTMLVHGLLLQNYPSLLIGQMSITAASSHIYERHFEMVEKILEYNVAASAQYKCRLPQCYGPAEAMAIIADRGQIGTGRNVPGHWHLYRFLYGEA